MSPLLHLGHPVQTSHFAPLDRPRHVWPPALSNHGATSAGVEARGQHGLFEKSMGPRDMDHS